jgi:hypothetical protein
MVDSLKMYALISGIRSVYNKGEEVNINTKYKIVDRKKKPVAGPLPKDSQQRIKEVLSEDPTLRSFENIGHKFTKEIQKKFRVGWSRLTLTRRRKTISGNVGMAWKGF